MTSRSRMFVAYCLLLAGYGASAMAADGMLLEAKPFVTPNGTTTLHAPVGWTTTVVSDKPSNTLVFFNNPDKKYGVQFGRGPNDGKNGDKAKEADRRKDRILKLYTSGGVYQGVQLEGIVLRDTPVRINAYSGHSVEIDRTDLTGKSRILYVTLCDANYCFELSSKGAIAEWEKNLPAIQQAMASFQAE